MKIKVNCDLCSGKDSKEIYKTKDILLNISNETFSLVRCLACCHVYLSPRPDSEDLKKYYPKSYLPYKQKKANSIFMIIIKRIYWRLNNFFNFFSKNDSSVKTVLDFGCGSGENILRLAQKFPSWEIYGYDASDYASFQAKERGIKIYSSIIEPNLMFDSIILNSVIEHVDSPTETIKMLSEKLKKGGTIEIKTPNFNSLSRVIFRNKWHALDSPRHLHLFTLKTLESLLEGFNFIIEKKTFKRGSTVEIKSLCNLFLIKKRRVWLLAGKLLDPFMFIIGKLGFASTIIITAKKIK